MTLVATDLDRTLVYSRGAIEAYGGGDVPVVAVERYRDADASFMTARAATSFAGLAERAVVVPTTTRTPEQLARITLPGPPPRYAVAANGGVLLVDGEPDDAWRRDVGRRLAGAAALPEVRAHVAAACDPGWTLSVREASELFCYAVVDRAALPAGFVAAETAWADARGWQVSLQGRKLYWVPRPLTKSAAVAEIARRAGAGHILAAGDSLLDADLLLAADAGIAARHGELVAAGWHAPHVVVTEAQGVLAGEEIVAWFVARVGDAVPIR
ncbi:hypothetical protein SAMN05443575_0207 [Jatrophihabitans endophyticus]|uniref:Hydroxymethylpyrimidine pyrophosphatase n=1 Tax=Jatrophihabitans endophyticus TaxID=1206085 RepID=A0A1M5CDV5_9ACTN|nr:HAD family hydrolase [Jatrophihabitans endophyticus]SHF52870.1 hypothetical protein SAMN05443575_0207 [Jatrophihabitans endophyticus]